MYLLQSNCNCQKEYNVQKCRKNTNTFNKPEHSSELTVLQCWYSVITRKITYKILNLLQKIGIYNTA